MVLTVVIDNMSLGNLDIDTRVYFTVTMASIATNYLFVNPETMKLTVLEAFYRPLLPVRLPILLRPSHLRKQAFSRCCTTHLTVILSSLTCWCW